MEWTLALMALVLLGVAAFSRLLSGTPVTPAMVFVAFGLLVGPELLGGIDVSSSGATVRALAETTLALVLFSDASRINLGALRRTVGVPVRLLGIGLPLTIALGAVAASVLFGAMTFWEAVILAVVLAPTDAALGQAVVTEPRVPQRIRQGLNVESGLNDGICVPLLFAAGRRRRRGIRDRRRPQRGHAAARGDRLRRPRRRGGRAPRRRDRQTGGRAGPHRGTVAAGRPGRGRRPRLRDCRRAGRIRLIPRSSPGWCSASRSAATPKRSTVSPKKSAPCSTASPSSLFGAVLLGPALADATWQLVLYAVLSLTIVRMAPVAIAMWGTRARPPTVGFLGWFGPRGLASIVFAVIVIDESALPHEALIVHAIYFTVGLSVLAHGISAAPLADRYARWYERHPHDRRPPMESTPAEAGRPRGPATAPTRRPPPIRSRSKRSARCPRSSLRQAGRPGRAPTRRPSLATSCMRRLDVVAGDRISEDDSVRGDLELADLGVVGACA